MIEEGNCVEEYLEKPNNNENFPRKSVHVEVNYNKSYIYYYK